MISRQRKFLFLSLLLCFLVDRASGFASHTSETARNLICSLGAAKRDNKAMSFLKKVGRLGHQRDFTHSVGVDEGPAGKASTNMRKVAGHQPLSTIVDDLSNDFPQTSHTQTNWTTFTDQVMGGVSTGTLCRRVVREKPANVLEGHVSLANNGGFLQMATSLGPNGMVIDGRYFEGIEIDVLYEGSEETETFNVHLKNAACAVPYAAYRASFSLPKLAEWTTIQLPWKQFVGHGPGAQGVAFDPSSLVRLAIVAIGKEMDVTLAVSGVRFYRAT